MWIDNNEQKVNENNVYSGLGGDWNLSFQSANHYTMPNESTKNLQRNILVGGWVVYCVWVWWEKFFSVVQLHM